MKTLRGMLVLSALSLLFLSCVSSNPYVKVDEAVYRGDYQGGAAVLEQDKKSIYRNKDAILYYLDEGMLSHYAGDYDTSSRLLEAGERAIEDAFTKSITMEIGTYILNDTTREYAGEDYEDIYLNAFNALNYYHRDNLEDALVEVRRMNNKLRFLASKYGVISSNLQQKALEDSVAIPPNPDITEAHFFNSALARYLGMIFYRGTGRADDARIDRDQIALAFADAPAVYTYPVPPSIDEELAIERGKARLNVIAFSGASPVKYEEAIRVFIPNARWIKIALPVFTYRPSQVSRIELAFDNGERVTLDLLEDMGAVARETFKEREGVIYTKSIIRGMLKGITSSVLDSASDRTDGNTSAILGLISLGTQIFAEASEQADLRMSRYFPARAWVGGVTLDPGVYSFTISYYAANGKTIAAFRHENVEVRANKLNLAEAVCLR